MIYEPEPEGATRLAQQLAQLSKGSARLEGRTVVSATDFAIVRRAAFDSISGVRRRILTAMIDDDDMDSLNLPRMTRKYACDDLEALGLLTERTSGYVLSKSTRSLVEAAQL